MVSSSGRFTPPKKDKHLPLSRDQEKPFYEAAKSTTDIATELSGRILMDYGLRRDELVHMESEWLSKKRDPKTNERYWAIIIPKYAYCTNGVGPTGKGNPNGINLYDTGQPCYICRNRTHERKVGKNGNGWLTEQQAKEYDFHPKTRSSAGETNQLDTTSCIEASEKLKDYLDAHGQFPKSHSSINRRIKEIGEKADLDRPVTPHCLRHTYGCRLAEGGATEGDIMNQMRHSDREMARWYADVRNIRQRRAFQKHFDATAEY